MRQAEVDVVECWQRKRGGLAGAGLGFAEQVDAVQQVGNAGSLNGRGGFIAHFSQGLKNEGFELQLTEVFDVGMH